MRARCLRVCQERYNWETAVVPYLALVSRLTSGSRDAAQAGGLARG